VRFTQVTVVGGPIACRPATFLAFSSRSHSQVLLSLADCDPRTCRTRIGQNGWTARFLAMNRKQLQALIKELQNLYTSVRFRPAPPSFSGLQDGDGSEQRSTDPTSADLLQESGIMIIRVRPYERASRIVYVQCRRSGRPLPWGNDEQNPKNAISWPRFRRNESQCDSSSMMAAAPRV
jgi:hypothetical protein